MGTTVVGADLDPEGARSISELIARSGIPSIVRTDIESEIWSKAIVNACINPLTAVLRVPNGRLLDSDVILRLMSEICVECTDVATYAGITLPEGRAIDRVLGVAKNTSGNRSSMLRDVELGRRTEIGQINGMIRKIGVVGGIPVPLNRALTSMIEAMEPLAAGERLIS
jgi:2-dehydropantoate 2-reductase